MRKSFIYAPVTQIFGRDLNAGARLLYNSTSDENLLDKALSWAKRANEVYETSNVMDTYARLLYKRGEKSKAIELEEKAIAFSRTKKISYKRFEAALLRMKAGETNID
jgi:tetratricopeptide (TPR) repeat protein